ncbi:hypothetical protein ACEPAF_9744 [Sanghuangporus sanghuang]
MENTLNHGVKRKREPRSNTEDINIASKLRGKLHHGLKEVKKATKKAKAFETQRIVKKLKDARKSGDESNIRHLEVQLESLKHIDLDDIAVRSLRSKIKKDPFLSKNADCQEAVSSELSLSPNQSTPTSSERALVESRMLSSKILSSEVVDVINSLKLMLGVGRQEMPPLGDHNDSDAGDLQESEEERRTTPKGMKAARSARKIQSEWSLSEGDANEDDEESNDEAAWTGFGAIHNDSGQSDTARSWESGSLHSQDEEQQPSVSDSSHSPSPPRPSLVKKARPTAAIPKLKAGKAGESAFLPSLSVGFISGSDSEWSESEAKIADMPMKKNRRGQRARKAIWEKKYGRNANHLKKLRESDVRDARVRTARGQRGGRGRGTTTETAASWGSHSGGIVRGRSRPAAAMEAESAAPAGSPHPKSIRADRGRNQNDLHLKHHGSQARGGAEDGKPSSNVRLRNNDRDDDRLKPLHPSWEAKRRLKEKESPAIVPSVGTKIKFT